MWARRVVLAPPWRCLGGFRGRRASRRVSQAGFDGAHVPWFRPRGKGACWHAKTEQLAAKENEIAQPAIGDYHPAVLPGAKLPPLSPGATAADIEGVLPAIARRPLITSTRR